MPPVHGWHSRSREPPAPDRDLIGLVILSSAFYIGEHLKEMVFVSSDGWKLVRRRFHCNSQIKGITKNLLVYLSVGTFGREEPTFLLEDEVYLY